MLNSFRPIFPTEEKERLLKKIVKHNGIEDKVEIVKIDGLLADFI